MSRILLPPPIRLQGEMFRSRVNYTVYLVYRFKYSVGTSQQITIRYELQEPTYNINRASMGRTSTVIYLLPRTTFGCADGRYTSSHDPCQLTVSVSRFRDRRKTTAYVRSRLSSWVTTRFRGSSVRGTWSLKWLTTSSIRGQV
jgi:hypothetical protein